MSPDREAVIGGDRDDCVFAFTSGLESVQHPAKVVIEVGDRGVVVRDVPADLVGIPRKIGQAFVADVKFAVVERMSLGKIIGEIYLVVIVPAEELAGRRPGIMWLHRRQV